MVAIGDSHYWTRHLFHQQLEAIGLQSGDNVMVHAGLRSVGPMLNGPDALIGAIMDTIGVTGTLLCYVNWDQQYEDALDERGYLPEALKPSIPPFDPKTSRASRDHGAFAEFIRTTPGALRSLNPGASVAAVGHRAEWFTASHALDYGYGIDSPFAKLVSAGGNVLMIGASLNTMSLLHHAEHLAQIPGKRVRHMEVPLQLNGRVSWHLIEEFDTVDPVVDGLPDDYFETIVREFLKGDEGRQAMIGTAPSVLVPAEDMVAFAVRWLEQRCGPFSH